MKDKKKIALFCGSFNPLHIGHLNVLEKAEAIFGKENVYICVGINPRKVYQEIGSASGFNDMKTIVNNRMVTAIDRVKKQVPTKNIEGYIGFLTDFVSKKEEEGFDVTIVRGLRNGYDLENEYNQTRFMWDQKPDLKIVYIPCDPLYAHVSSSAYRELESIKEGSGYPYLVK